MLQNNINAILDYFTFDTARLSIKPVDASALDMLASLYCCSKTMQYIAPPFSYLKTKTMLEKMLHKQTLQQCVSLILRIQHKTDNTDLGIGGIPSIEFNHKKAEVGVMLLANAQGKGIAVEAARGIVVRLINLGIIDIYMDIDPENKAAIIGANKVGFFATNKPTRFIYKKPVQP